MRAVPVHAQPQLGRKAGGADLRRAVGDGVHQAVVPAPGVARRVGRQQHRELLHLGFFQRTDPLGIETRRHHQRKQLRGVAGFRRARQQLAAQALGQFADKGGARRKAEIGQQGRDIDRLDQCFPPGLQTRLQLGLLLHGFDEGLHPRHGGLDRGLVAANPFKQLDQPDMAVGQFGSRVQRPEQLGQVFHRRSHCHPVSAGRARQGCCRSSLPVQTGAPPPRSARRPRPRKSSCRAWCRWGCAGASRWCTGRIRRA